MEMFGFGRSLREMLNRKAAARRGRQMEQVFASLPSHVRADIGLDRPGRYFVPRMLGE